MMTNNIRTWLRQNLVTRKFVIKTSSREKRKPCRKTVGRIWRVYISGKSLTEIILKSKYKPFVETIVSLFLEVLQFIILSRLNSFTSNSRAVRYLRVSALYYARQMAADKAFGLSPNPYQFNKEEQKYKRK